MVVRQGRYHVIATCQPRSASVPSIGYAARMSSPAPRRRKSPREKTITVPGNLIQACHEFNTGLYFECHESLEEIWQEEEGEVRDLYKGLIQIAAAFVHITRGNRVGATRLLTTGTGYLGPYRAEGAMGFDVEAICATAERALAYVRTQPENEIAFNPAVVPVYACDTTALATEAVRWRAWGFDRAGAALEMTIIVAE